MKKSQAAMEFLMTYGWAILVVLVAIAALAYFGVLDPNKFVGEAGKCTVGGGEFKEFPNACADNCNAGDICAQVLTESCDCGEGKCWNDEQKKCIGE